MNHDEALAEAARRNADPKEPGLWSAQEGEAGGWRLVHVAAPGLARSRPVGSHVESKPKPSEPDDPRTSIFRNIPPYGG